MLKQVKANKRKVWRQTYGKPARARAAIKLAMARQVISASAMTAKIISTGAAFNASLLSFGRSAALANNYLNTIIAINDILRKTK